MLVLLQTSAAQRPKRCKPVHALARVACAVPPALLARGGNGCATRAPSVQRVNMGGVCNRQGYCPCCGADAAARQQQCDEQCSHHSCCTAGYWWGIWRPIRFRVQTCASAASFSATTRSDHCAAGSIVCMPKTAITGAFRERSGVLVPYRTLAFLLIRNRCFCSHFSRKLVICASNLSRVLLSTS